MTTSQPTTSADLARASNALSIDLLHRLAGDENLVFSPASIEFALCMTWAGSRNETAEQMARVLHLEGAGADVHQVACELMQVWNNPVINRGELRVASRLFGEGSFSFAEPFLDLTRQYGAELERLDFLGEPEACRRQINEWAANQTEDRIRDLLPSGSISALTTLVLVNAVYFLGDWAEPFEEPMTSERPFHCHSSRSVLVPTMHQTAPFRYAQANEHQILEMPFSNYRYSMAFLLPSAGQSLAAFEKSLTASRLADDLRRTRDERVAVSLPRFRLESASLPLKAVLSALGMPLAFDDRLADFRAMTTGPLHDDEPLHLGDVHHAAFIEVNEHGAVAAAATAASAEERSALRRPVRPKVFQADRPFLFLIRDQHDGTIFFLGRVVDPSGGAASPWRQCDESPC